MHYLKTFGIFSLSLFMLSMTVSLSANKVPPVYPESYVSADCDQDETQEEEERLA